jgi:hypothetical protein
MELASYKQLENFKEDQYSPQSKDQALLLGDFFFGYFVRRLWR